MKLLKSLKHLLSDSVRLRLRSDVQVAAYLSGGLDSSATTHYIKEARTRSSEYLFDWF